MSTSNIKKAEEIYLNKCLQKAEQKELVFLGFAENLTQKRVSKTFCILMCEKHNVHWQTTSIDNFLYKESKGCCVCKDERRKVLQRKPQKVAEKEIRVVCDQLGLDFLGWEEGYTNNLSSLKLMCRSHGTVWICNSLVSFLSGKYKDCPKCHEYLRKERVENNTEKHIKDFVSTGKFPKGTVFTRSERETKEGVKNYWYVYCPVCDETNESFIGSLKFGNIPCDCTEYASPRFLYVISCSEYLKFGITSDYNKRIKMLSRNNSVDYKFLNIYDFEGCGIKPFNVETVLKRSFRDLFKDGYKDSDNVPDGYTETLPNFMYDKLNSLIKVSIEDYDVKETL